MDFLTFLSNQPLITPLIIEQNTQSRIFPRNQKFSIKNIKRTWRSEKRTKNTETHELLFQAQLKRAISVSRTVHSPLTL